MVSPPIIRDKRLDLAYYQLTQQTSSKTIADIAQEYGLAISISFCVHSAYVLECLQVKQKIRVLENTQVYWI